MREVDPAQDVALADLHMQILDFKQCHSSCYIKTRAFTRRPNNRSMPSRRPTNRTPPFPVAQS